MGTSSPNTKDPNNTAFTMVFFALVSLQANPKEAPNTDPEGILPSGSTLPPVLEMNHSWRVRIRAPQPICFLLLFWLQGLPFFLLVQRESNGRPLILGAPLLKKPTALKHKSLMSTYDVKWVLKWRPSPPSLQPRSCRCFRPMKTSKQLM